jgi:hypothetical protein
MAAPAEAGKSLRKSTTVPDLLNPGDGVVHWSCQSHGVLISPKIPQAQRPAWLKTTSVNRKTYLSRATGNVHGLKSCDYGNINWSLPKMFGDEKYAFSLIDIEDPRYTQEAANMGRKLTRLNYEKQIIDLEWRRTYKSLLRAEQHERTLGESVGHDERADKRREQRRTEIKTQISDFKAHLLTLQDQKDMYESCIEDIWERCKQIKESIRTENDLESLRKELSARVQLTYAPDDEFWTQKFNISAMKGRRPSRDWELAVME